MRIKGFSKAQIILNNLAIEKFAASGFTKDPTDNNIVVSVKLPDCIEYPMYCHELDFFDHNLFIKVYLKGNQLGGYVSARSTTKRMYGAVSSYISLEKIK